MCCTAGRHRCTTAGDDRRSTVQLRSCSDNHPRVVVHTHRTNIVKVRGVLEGRRRGPGIDCAFTKDLFLE